jgi:hypothetical protein
MLGIGLGLTSMRGGQSPAGYLAARGLDWSNAGFDFAEGERWWLPSNSGDPTSAPRWATRTEWAARFTRAGSAYYVNALGNLALAGTNELRIDYSSGSPRVLLEGASSNLVTYSGDTSNAVWTGSNLTKTSGQLDPLGGTSAAIFNSNADGVRSIMNATASASVALNTSYTGSYFVKSSSTGFAQLTFPSIQFGSTQYANFNLSGNGSVTATGGSVNAQIFKMFGGWYRISLTATATLTGLADGIQLIGITNGTAGRAESVNSPFSIITWGCNVVAQYFLSSYINSVDSASSRVGDIFRAPVGAENVMLGRDTFGVLARCDKLSRLAGGNNTFVFPSVIGSVLSIVRHGGVILNFDAFVNDTIAPGIVAAVPSGSTFDQTSVAFTQTTLSRRLSANGGSIASATTSTNPVTRIDIGERGGGFAPDYRGYKTVAFGPTLLSDAQLVSLSGAL